MLRHSSYVTQSCHKVWNTSTIISKCLFLRCRYKQNALAVSRTFRDRPMSPLNTAIFWTEYVIRHRGAPHMRSAAVDLAWYQYLLLDVIAFLLVIGAGSLITIYIIFRKLLRSRKSKLLDSKAKNKKTN
jgi:glucuronosyltransferase